MYDVCIIGEDMRIEKELLGFIPYLINHYYELGWRNKFWSSKRATKKFLIEVWFVVQMIGILIGAWGVIKNIGKPILDSFCITYEDKTYTIGACQYYDYKR